MTILSDPQAPRGVHVVTYQGEPMTERDLVIAYQAFDRGMQGDLQFRRTIRAQLDALHEQPNPLMEGFTFR